MKSLLVLLFEIAKRGAEQELSYKRTVGGKSFRAKKYRVGGREGEHESIRLKFILRSMFPWIFKAVENLAWKKLFTLVKSIPRV